MSLHALQRRILVEELVRRRAPEEGRRYAASQRSGCIDPNPHQLDAVVFALRRIPEGGCILADEVGLGKTIEAGLIISQLMAEGARRVLLIVPKALLGQWKAELFDLFGIDARETRADPESVGGDGVFIVHREFAGGQKGGPLLWGSDPFELVVIDEAHEMFAGIYKRYNRHGLYDTHSSKSQTAGRVRELVHRHRAPVLLLTATPIQNTLTELWGLVQYVEPTGSLLGNLSTFRELFCGSSDRDIAEDQAFELRRRLRHVLQRTLRRQAQEFLEVPFVERRARLVSYRMSAEEQSLYDDISEWLLNPNLQAFGGHNGRLLLIGFLRRMASSVPALTASLERVAQRIRGHLDGGRLVSIEAILGEFGDDLEDDEPAKLQAESEPPTPKNRLRTELEQVEAFVARTRSLAHDGKAASLVEAVSRVRQQGETGESSGKVVVFTESITTQDYIARVLLEHGVPLEEITLFRGHNSGPRAQQALEQWMEAEGSKRPPEGRPSHDVAMRLALVDEFRRRSSVFISTEAGAKGLNLQFCETLINYDLPWNPQRIEQRIGRVHRYGQKNKVMVINFLAEDNEAQQLLFDILSRKLELFGTVLDASDAVLHAAGGRSAESVVSAVGADLSRTLADIYGASRSMAEVTDRLRELGTTLDGRREAFEEEQARTAALIEDRFDEGVRKVFTSYKDQLSDDLAELDRDLDRIVCAYLEATEARFERRSESERVRYTIEPSSKMPAGYRDGASVWTGRMQDMSMGSALHLGHPLVRASVAEARAATEAIGLVRFAPATVAWPEDLQPLRGQKGHAVLTRVRYYGLEPVDHLVWVAITEQDDEPLPEALVQSLLELQPSDEPGDAARPSLEQEWIDDLVEERVMLDQALVAELEQARFDKMMRQLDRYLQDQIMVLQRRRGNLFDQLERVERRHEKETSNVGRQTLSREMTSLSSQLHKIEVRIESLSRAEDDEYRQWVDALQQRRYRAPEVERLVEFDFVVGDAPEPEC